MRRPRPNKDARAVFEEFYDTDDTSRAFAKAKLQSGTAALTPESVTYMRGVIAKRKEVAARIAAEEAAAKAEKANASQ